MKLYKTLITFSIFKNIEDYTMHYGTILRENSLFYFLNKINLKNRTISPFELWKIIVNNNIFYMDFNPQCFSGFLHILE